MWSGSARSTAPCSDLCITCHCSAVEAPTFLGFPGGDDKVFPCPTNPAITDAVGWPSLSSEGRTPCWHTFCFEAEDYFWMPQGWLTRPSSNPEPQDSVPFTLLLQFYFFRIKEEASEHILNVFPFSAEHRLSRNLALCPSVFGVWRRLILFFPPLSQDHNFQCKYLRVINEDGSSPIQGPCSLLM